MKRLTTYEIDGPVLKHSNGKTCDKICFSRCSCDDCPVGQAIEKLTAYEDAEEQQLIVKLPCTPGTIIYLVGNGKILEYNFMGVVQFLNYKPTLFGRQKFGNYEDVQIANVEQWGETVFASREEAERVL